MVSMLCVCVYVCSCVLKVLERLSVLNEDSDGQSRWLGHLHWLRLVKSQTA